MTHGVEIESKRMENGTFNFPGHAVETDTRMSQQSPTHDVNNNDYVTDQ